jgi:hypothetical protein
MTAEEKLLDAGYYDVVVFSNPGYDDALIGVTTDNQAVYDYDKMLEYLVNHDNMSEDEAADFISYNTLRALPYAGESAPIIIYSL